MYLDPSQWFDPWGAAEFYGLMAVILAGTLIKLFSGHWEDWLDERWGRGSVRDNWWLRRMERDAGL